MEEVGFYHPDRGYWQTITTPDADTLAGYPEGTISVPLKPGANYEWLDGAWVHVPPATTEALAAEREGRGGSRFPAKAALLQAGLLDAAEHAVAQADPVTQLAWAEAVEYRRTSPAIAAIGAALDLTDEDIDELFVAAAGIEA